MKLSILAVALVTFVSAASAAPLCVSGGTLASYQALGSGGCMIGNALFSNFTYTGTALGQGAVVANTQITLTPAGSGTLNPGPGIIFASTAWVVPSAKNNGDSFVDSVIGFTVSVTGAPVINDGTLTLSSSSVTGTGTGHISGTINASSLAVDTGGPSTSHVVFPVTSSVAVSKDLHIDVPQGNPGSGTAQINSFEEDFSQAAVPEPVGLALAGSGLLALGFWRRRTSRR